LPLGVFYLYFLFHKPLSGRASLWRFDDCVGDSFLRERQMVSNFCPKRVVQIFVSYLAFSASTRPCVSTAILLSVSFIGTSENNFSVFLNIFHAKWSRTLIRNAKCSICKLFLKKLFFCFLAFLPLSVRAFDKIFCG